MLCFALDTVKWLKPYQRKSLQYRRTNKVGVELWHKKKHCKIYSDHKTDNDHVYTCGDEKDFQCLPELNTETDHE